MKIRIFYSPLTTMIVPASVTSRFLECYATSAANLRGAKQRKKVRFTTASGGARGGANGCSKQPHLERAFFADSQYFAEHQNGFGFLHLSN